MRDYLWDRSGDPDPDIEHLEQTLAPLRFRPEPVLTLAEPEARPPRSWWRSVAVGSTAAAAAAVLTWWLVRPPVEPQLETGGDARVARVDPPPSAEPAVGTAFDEPVLEDEEDEDEDEDEDDEIVEGEDAASEKRRSKRGKRSSKSSGSSSASSSSSKSSSPSKSSSSSKSGGSSDSLDVDCVLNPDLSKCRRGGASKSSGSSGSSDPSFPEKLTTAQIKAGVDAVKGQAKACGPRHDAKPGTRVAVKLSIAGATGTVTSAVAQEPHRSTALGRCVAAALKQAVFARFQKSSIGVVYPIRL